MNKAFDKELISRIISDKHSDTRQERQRKAKLLQGFLDMNLTKTQKKYIILYYRDEMKICDIAKLCSVAPSTVSRTIGRARRRLYHALTGRELMLRYSKKQ